MEFNMKSIKLFFAFALFFLGALCNGVVAQSNNVEQGKDTLLTENSAVQQKALDGELSIDELVADINKALATEDGKLGCVRKGNTVYIEQEVSATDYDDIKSAMESFGWLVKRQIKKAFSKEKEVVESLRMMNKKGYGFAYSFKCGENEPVVIELDF